MVSSNSSKGNNNRDQVPQKGSGSRKSVVTDNSGGRGQKRPRDPAPTGQTPPAKKPDDRSTPRAGPSNGSKAKKYSYAQAASGALRLVILRTGDNHITRDQFFALQDRVDKVWLEILDAGKEDPFVVDKWEYSTSMASVYAADGRSADAIAGIIKSMGLEFDLFDRLMERRRPSKIISGLVMGPAANRDREYYDRALKHEVEAKKIPGRLEVFSMDITTPRGRILKLRADDIALARLGELDNTIHIGSAGRILFTEVKEVDGVDKVLPKDAGNKQTTAEDLARLEQLNKEIAEAKRFIVEKTKARREIETAETASVGSLGMSEVNISPAETERLLAVSEGEENAMDTEKPEV